MSKLTERLIQFVSVMFLVLGIGNAVSWLKEKNEHKADVRKKEIEAMDMKALKAENEMLTSKLKELIKNK